jgi:phosphatidylethanolamine/phosphatidyl-N-methylethanolamine N-methyltransferase
MSVGSRWERRRYALWAPLYDVVVYPLRKARRRAIEGLALRASDRVLLVGAGTGEDLPFFPHGVSVVGVDLTAAMLRRARPKARETDRFAVMDAEALALGDGTFDVVVLHLILAVVPDPALCLAEAARVLRRGGTIAVFDKFTQEGRPASRGRRLLNRVTRPIATDITRNLEEIIRGSGVHVARMQAEPALGGRFTIARIVVAPGRAS